MPSQPSPPNVLIFLASDLGYGDLGCYGSPRNRTPNLDRLAAEGVRFTDCHSNGCMCSPSRAALQTGRYQQRSGLEFVLNHHTRDLPPMSADACTYGHAFRAAGYATGFFGTYHTGYLPDQSPLKMGYDEFVGLCGGLDHHSHVTRWGEPNWWHGAERVSEPGYVSDLIASHAMGFLERNRDQPFCLHVADFLVHFPWQGPRDKPDFEAGMTYDSPDAKFGSRPDRRAAYREMVEAMDSSAGRLLARLDSLGLAERTLVIFATDHGGHHLVADNGPLAGAKGSLLEGGHRIPALARWPGRIPAGQLIHDPVMLMDLFPTFADLCRLPVPEGHAFDGASLVPLLLEGRPLPERTLFWRHGADRAIRRGPWKWLADSTGERLCNLAEDPGETRDRKAGEPERAAALRAEFDRWDAQVGPPPGR